MRRVRSASLKQLTFISKLRDQKGQEAYREVVKVVRGSRRTLTMFSASDAYHIINLLLKWDDIKKASLPERPIANRFYEERAEPGSLSGPATEPSDKSIDEAFLSFKKKMKEIKDD